MTIARNEEEVVILKHHLMFLMSRSTFSNFRELLAILRVEVSSNTFGDDADKECANAILSALECYERRVDL